MNARLLEFLATLIILASACYQDCRAEILSRFDLVAIETPRVIGKANNYLGEPPETVTSSHCERSAGGRHDYYSEGDYWWPDPEKP